METNSVQTQQTTTINFSDEQIKLIKSQIAPKATNDELQLFLYQAKRTGLDPLARQIYCIHRYDKNQGQKMTVQTSIDGFRVVAERSGDYGGQDEPEFIEENGKISHCKIRVYKFRGQQRYQASVGVAYWDEYVPTAGQDYMWKKMPHTMLAKVAEALALRKAFPQDLSGLYTNDEMQQADNAPAVVEEDAEQLKALHTEFMELHEEFSNMNPEEAIKIHPNKWRGQKTVKTYISAISAIKLRIQQELEKV
jgi:phage recombination protein Bet